MYKHDLLRRDVSRDVLMYRHAVSYRICVRDKHMFVSYNDTYDNEILYGRTDVLVHIHGMRGSVSYECARIIHARFCFIRVYITYIRS